MLSVVTAASTELFLRGGLNVAGGLVANAGMAAVTLILYTTFKPVNKRLAFLAAFFNFVGLTFEALRFLALMVMITVAISIDLKVCTIPVPWWYEFGFLTLGPLAVIITPRLFGRSKQQGAVT